MGSKKCRARVNSAVRGIWIAAIRPYPNRPEEPRADIRDRSVVVAMHMIRRALRGEALPV